MQVDEKNIIQKDTYPNVHACLAAQSCLILCNPWTVAHQVPLLMEFSRQKYWNGLPLPPQRDLPEIGIKPISLVAPALAGEFFTTEPPGKPKNEVVFEYQSSCELHILLES